MGPPNHPKNPIISGKFGQFWKNHPHFGKFETHSFGDPSFQHISTDPQLRTAALVAMEFAVRR